MVIFIFFPGGFCQIGSGGKKVPNNYVEPESGYPGAFDNYPPLTDQEDEDATSLQEQLVEEINKRAKKQFSMKSRMGGQFAKEETKELSWKNYVRVFFNQHPGFEIACCGTKYKIANSFITHRLRHHK